MTRGVKEAICQVRLRAPSGLRLFPPPGLRLVLTAPLTHFGSPRGEKCRLMPNRRLGARSAGQESARAQCYDSYSRVRVSGGQCMEPEQRNLLNRTRRQFFNHCFVGLGPLALGSYLGASARAANPPQGQQPARTEGSAFRSQGQKRHLPVHGRRTEPVRTVRAQERVATLQREGDSGIVPRREALRLHGELFEAGSATVGNPPRVQALRTVGPVGLRVPATHRAGSR